MSDATLRDACGINHRHRISDGLEGDRRTKILRHSCRANKQHSGSRVEGAGKLLGLRVRVNCLRLRVKGFGYGVGLSEDYVYGVGVWCWRAMGMVDED